MIETPLVNTMLNELVVLKYSKYSFRNSNIVEIPQGKDYLLPMVRTFKYTAAVLWNDPSKNF